FNLIMYISIQTVCNCYGNLVFESLHCDRCHSLIPFQLSDEMLIQQRNNNDNNNSNTYPNNDKKSTSLAPATLFSYNHQQHNPQQSMGRIRFRALCPFCNSFSFTMRTFCKRERLYYHLRIQNLGQNDQHFLSLTDSSTGASGITIDQYGTKRDQNVGFDDTLSSQTKFNTSFTHSDNIPYVNPTMANNQIEHERNSLALNELEGDLFTVLKQGLFFDTIIVCQDDVKLKVHRCILGGRSTWFRNLISENHESNSNDDYILQMNIDDISSDTMNEILNYIYTNRCHIDLKNAPNLLLASKRFELEKLKKQISEFLSYRLTIENAIEFLICAHESNTLELKQACIRLINRHAEKIKRTEKWNKLKTDYVDLVPELYENRVDPSVTTTFPDVFNKKPGSREGFSSLNEVYEHPPKPIQQQQQQQQLKILPSTRRTSLNKVNNSGPYPSQRNDSSASSVIVMDDPIPVKTWKNVSNNNTNKQNMNHKPPKRRNSIRTVLPAVLTQNTEIDYHRRPVNVNEKSKSIPQAENRTYSPVRQQHPSPPLRAAPASQSARKIIQLEMQRNTPAESKTISRFSEREHSD
ncbi:unnamed protein product, partial [Didymodactylos carnosus]